MTQKYAAITTSDKAQNNRKPKNHAIMLPIEILVAAIEKLIRFIAFEATINKNVMSIMDKAKSTHKRMEPKCHVLLIGSYIEFFSF